MKKQTAVEWLVEKLRQQKFVTESQIFIAKKMEKEQIIDAFDNGAEDWTPIEYSDGQHYYNQNFES